MASLLEKVSTLISANLHYMVDQALKSNSLAVIDQYIRQVETNLADLEDAAATVGGEVKSIQRRLIEHQHRESEIDRAIDAFLVEGNEAAAVAAQSQLNSVKRLVETYQEQVERQQSEFQKLLDAKVKLEARLATMKVGDGLDDDTAFGPLINDDAVEKVREHIDDAISKGGEVVFGGSQHNLGGTFFQPTIVKNVTQNMAVAQEETFGPMAPLFKFDTVDEVIEMANDTIFGLASYFYAKDLSRVYKVAEALEYGIVGVNTGIISTEVAPFGGVKQSGLGREGSHYGIEEFLELKYVCMAV